VNSGVVESYSNLRAARDPCFI